MIERHLNKIFIPRLDIPAIYNEFLHHVYKGREAGFSDFNLLFPEEIVSFPNTAVPICGSIQFFKEVENVNFHFDNPNQLFPGAIGLIDPFKIEQKSSINNLGVLNRIWEFRNFDQVAWLVDEFKMELSRLDQFEKGVLRSLDWCLNEVMDNVFGHAQINKGYVMGQIHRTSKHIAFTIFDFGIGIYNSLKDSNFKPTSVSEAIKLSLLEGVTRDTVNRQGNGLYGLKEMVAQNEGRLTIVSSSGRYFFDGIYENTFNGLTYFSKKNGSTTVDFQLDYQKPILLSNILFRGKQYDFLDLNLEKMETTTGEMQFKVSERTESYGTRDSGEQLRNEVINIYNQSDSIILLDFSGIDIISSSFADELVGKLVIELGFFGFNNIVKLKGMNSDVQAIVQRSVGQRMAESFGKNI